MALKIPDIDFSAVLASTVHDMKNSLCMLIQSTELVQHESQHLSNDAKSELARLNYEANRLNSNLLQLLALYRLEKQQLPVQINEHFLADIIEEVSLRNQYFIQQNRIHFVIEQTSDLHWFLDYDLIVNLLNDALANAARYCKTAILLKVYQDKDWLKLEVHDDGSGFPQQMLAENEHIDMSQPNLANNHTGLGIFFAKLIANAHANKGRFGAIELANGGRFGGGVFTLSLP